MRHQILSVIWVTATTTTVSKWTFPVDAQECGQGWYPLVVNSNIGVNNPVKAMTIWNGELIAAGEFTVAGGTPANRVARWDGTSWHAMLGGITNGVFFHVWAVAVYNGDLVVGGDFDTAGGIPASNIARWDGSSWHSMDTGLDNRVNAMTIWNGELVAGGSFVSGSGATLNRIARWNGSTWQPFGSGMNNAVHALTVYGEDLVAGGAFTSADGQIVNRIARWDGVSWNAFASGNQVGTNGIVDALVVWSGDLIAGGAFTTAGGSTKNRIARWNGTSWNALGTGLTGGTGAMNALTAWNGDLIAGGGFAEAGGIPVKKIATWDGSTWGTFSFDGQIGIGGTGTSTEVHCLNVYAGDLVVGGGFTSSGGQVVNRIAQWGITSNGNQYWIGPKGGSGSGLFQTPEHWLCGLVPGGFATVIFDNMIMPIAPAYSVSLGADAATRRLIIHTDEVTLNLANRNFDLTAPQDDPQPSLIVGEFPGEDARLIVRNTLTLPRRVYATSVVIGNGIDSIGTLTVRNTSTTSSLSAGLTAEGNVTVGRLGMGALTVENRADLDYGRVGSSFQVGESPDSNPNEPDGKLTVRRGGNLLATDFMDTVSIGVQDGATGDVQVDGAGTIWSGASNNFYVGEYGNATMTISNGGGLFSTTLNELVLARNAGSTASVLVTGAGSMWFEAVQPITVGGLGEAFLEVLNGGVVEAANINALLNGTIRGDSSIVGDLFNLGSVVPVDSSDGTAVLVINGNYRQIGPPPGESNDLSGKLRISVDDNETSRLDVTGTAELGGGLFIDVLPGSSPNWGSAQPVLTADSIHPLHTSFDVAFSPVLDGKFMKVNYPASPFSGGGTDGGGSITLTVQPLSTVLAFNPLEPPLPGSPTAGVIGDFNSDQLDDLAITITNGPGIDGDLLVFLSSGGGAFEELQQYPTSAQPSAITVGQFNAGGSLDIAVANREDGVGNGTAMVFGNNGTGTLFSQLGSPIPVGVNPSSIAAGDFRNLGVDDLLVANTDSDSISHLQNDGTGGNWPVIFPIPTPRPIIVTPADIDNPRDLAFVVLSTVNSTATVFKNAGGGNFPPTQSVTYPVGSDPLDLHVVDLNDDGHLDVVTANLQGDASGGGGTVSVLVNTGTFGGLAPAVNLPLQGAAAFSIVAANLDHPIDPQPGDPDLVDLAVLVDNGGTSEIRILRNDTTTSTVALTLLDEVNAAPDGSFALLTGDLDGVNGPDLIALNDPSNPMTSSPGGTDGPPLGPGTPPLRLLLNDVRSRPLCAADLAPGTGDQSVGVPDLLFIINNWGPCPNPNNCPADLAPPPSGDGTVGVPDLLAIINSWGPCPN